MINPVIANFGLGGAEIILIGVILTMLFAFMAIPAVLAYLVLKRIPVESRTQKPELAFLLMIPLFSLVWAFFVHPKVAESLKNYYDKNGLPQSDYGEKLALWFCITSACGLIPMIGFIAAIASLVLGVMFYLKAFELSAKIKTQSY
jgi:hypothetical protein